MQLSGCVCCASLLQFSASLIFSRCVGGEWGPAGAAADGAGGQRSRGQGHRAAAPGHAADAGAGAARAAAGR